MPDSKKDHKRKLLYDTEFRFMESVAADMADGILVLELRGQVLFMSPEAGWQWADLHKGLDSTLNIVNNEINYKAEVIKDYCPELPAIECIASQRNQVLINVLVNAAHEITAHGTITK